MDTVVTRRGLLGLGAGLMVSLAGPARADVLSGRRILFLIGNEGSGGYEAYARLFAKHLALALPDTRLSVEVVPTADGRLAAKRIFDAPPGDLTIGLFESALLYAAVSGEEGLAFDLARFNWLGKLAVDERVIVTSKPSGIGSIGDLAKRAAPAVYPASTVASRGSFECYILNAIFRLPIKPVAGYDGAERMLAMISGEGQLVLGSYASARKMVEDEGGVIILRLNAVPHPEAPESAPLLRDIAPKPVSKLVELIELSANLGRWIAAPPDAAAGDVEALRAAFDAVIASPAFLAEARDLEIPIDAEGGNEVQRHVASLLDREMDLRAELQSAVDCGKRRAEGDRVC